VFSVVFPSIGENLWQSVDSTAKGDKDAEGAEGAKMQREQRRREAQRRFLCFLGFFCVFCGFSFNRWIFFCGICVICGFFLGEAEWLRMRIIWGSQGR